MNAASEFGASGRNCRHSTPHLSSTTDTDWDVLGIGDNQPAPLRALFDMAPNGAAAAFVRRVFAARGKSFVHLLQSREAAAALSARERDAQIQCSEHSSINRLCLHQSSSLPRAEKNISVNSSKKSWRATRR